MPSMPMISSATVTVTMSSAAVLEDENTNKVDEEAKDGHDKEPLVFHLEQINVSDNIPILSLTFISGGPCGPFFLFLPLAVRRASRRLR